MRSSTRLEDADNARAVALALQGAVLSQRLIDVGLRRLDGVGQHGGRRQRRAVDRWAWTCEAGISAARALDATRRDAAPGVADAIHSGASSSEQRPRRWWRCCCLRRATCVIRSGEESCAALSHHSSSGHSSYVSRWPPSRPSLCRAGTSHTRALLRAPVPRPYATPPPAGRHTHALPLLRGA